MASLLLGERCLTGSEVHLRERGDSLGRVGVCADLEGGRERSLQIVDRLLRLAEQERQAAEVVEQPADALPVCHLLVQGLRPLGVGAREHPLALPLGDERGLEVHVGDGLAVAEALRQFERPLDVLAGGLPVALTPVAPRTPFEDMRSQPVAGKSGALRQCKGFAEQASRRRDR